MNKYSKQYFHLWDDFKDSLSFKNRFIVNHDILEHFRNAFSQSELLISKGTTLYRARKYSNGIEFIEAFNKALDVIKNGERESEISDYARIKNQLNLEDLQKRSDSGYWGYNSEDSFVPKDNNMVKDGRANPKRIKYLYVADRPMTAAAEMRPLIDSRVSVAEILVNEPLRIIDLSYDFLSNVSEQFKMLAYLIIDEFSKPNDGEPFDYLITQFITEYIKDLGYDGIKFSSSLYKRGRNYVIFNYENCEPQSSRLYEIDDVCYELKCIGPVGHLLGEEDLYHWKLNPYRTERIERWKKNLDISTNKSIT